MATGSAPAAAPAAPAFSANGGSPCAAKTSCASCACTIRRVWSAGSAKGLAEDGAEQQANHDGNEGHGVPGGESPGQR
jgi:hypothetical protein